MIGDTKLGVISKPEVRQMIKPDTETDTDAIR